VPWSRLSSLARVRAVPASARVELALTEVTPANGRRKEEETCGNETENGIMMGRACTSNLEVHLETTSQKNICSQGWFHIPPAPKSDTGSISPPN